MTSSRRIQLLTRQVIWGGGEVLLVQLADELRLMDHDARVVAPSTSEIADRRPDLLGQVPSPHLVVANEFQQLWRSRLRRPRTAHVFLVHGDWQTSRLRNAFARATQCRVFAVSTWVQQAVESNGFLAADSCPVLPLGPDWGRFRRPTASEREDSRAMYGLSAGAFVAVFVGRLQDIKRPELFIDAIRKAGVRGLLVTPTPTSVSEQAVLDAARTAAEGNDSVRLLHGVDVVRAFWAADVYVSTSQFESLGVAHMEAMACGLPVVTTAHGGPGDLVVTGVNGYHLSASADASEIAEVLRTLADSPTLLADLAGQAELPIRHRSMRAVSNMILDSPCALPT